MMIACRSLFRAERACIFTNSYLRFKSFQKLQVCYLHSSLKFNSIADSTRRQEFMDRKSNKKIPPMWRPISTQTNSAQECPKELQVDVEDCVEKVELSQALENEINYGPECVAEIGAINVASDYKTFQSNDEEGTSGNISVPSEFKHSVSLEIGASVMRFVKGKWGSSQQKIEEEFGVKLIIPFPPSRKEDAIVIEGSSVDSITRASERIHSIVDEAVKGPNFDYSHFVSLPLALHPELVEKLVNFQATILETNNITEDENLVGNSKEDNIDNKDEGNVAVNLKVEDTSENVKVDINKIQRVSYAPKVSEQETSKHSALLDTRIEKSIFIKPATFHLTVLMLKLWNKDRVAAAAEVLQSVASKVHEALDSRPISIRLKGLDCMKGSLAKARVIHAPVEEIGSEGRLERACQVIVDAFVEAGLVLEEDTQRKLKLHATVMNARHRKRKQKTPESFDARGIFKKYGSEEWGEYLLPEAHLSQRFVFDENGYYYRCSSLPFPKSV